MLTPQPHAPIQWGWMHGENNGSKPTDQLNRVPPFSFLLRRRSIEISLPFAFLSFLRKHYVSLDLSLFFCLRQKSTIAK